MATTPNELRTRIISGVVLMALVLFATLYHPDSFLMLLLIGGVILLKEWRGLNHTRSFAFMLAGIAYIALALGSLWWLRSHADGDSTSFIMLCFALVWATDSAAYVYGKSLGGKKLWPSVSPNKTWAGAIGGITGAVAVAVFCYEASLFKPFEGWIFALAVLISIATQLGDLLESHLKRRAGVKDSGTLIPGHGGLFDRVDGLMAAAPIFALCIAIHQGMS